MTTARVKSVLVLGLLLAGFPTVAAHAQESGCTLVKGTYFCDWQAFRARFARPRTVGIESKPMERATERRLRELATSLGKNPVGAGEAPDVILRVVPATETGIAIGPADQPLARLEVLAPGVDGRPSTLLWMETLAGQADKPWPMVVAAVANQFQARFGK